MDKGSVFDNDSLVAPIHGAGVITLIHNVKPCIQAVDTGHGSWDFTASATSTWA